MHALCWRGGNGRGLRRRVAQSAAFAGQEEGRAKIWETRTWMLLGISAQLGTSLPVRNH